MKLIKILFLMLVMLNHSSAYGAKLKCEFKIYNWDIVGDLYTCDVKNNGIFHGTRVTIDSIEGEHLPGKTNNDVQGINIEDISNVNFFPANIEKHFKNLILITIYKSQLQEIRSDDLQPFPNLKYLSLLHNKIKVIEKYTFKYNPQLEVIWLFSNEISHIDYKAFDQLNHLEKLWLSGNKCKKSISEATSRSDVLNAIKQLQQGDCSGFDIIIQKAINAESEKLTSKINDLKTQSEKVDSRVSEVTQNFNAKLQAQDEINKKKFSETETKFTALINKMEQKQAEMNQQMNRKIENLEKENLQLKSDIVALKTQDVELHKKMQADKSEMQSKIRALTDENNQMKQEINSLKAVDEQLKEENQAIRNQFNAKLQEQDEINKNKISEIGEKFATIFSKMKQQHDELNQQVNKKIENLEKQNLDIVAQLNKNINAVDEQLKEENQATKRHLAEITMRAIETIKNVEKLQSSNKIMKAHFAKIQDYDIVYKQLIKSKNQLSAEYRAITETLTHQTRELIRDVTAMKPPINILSDNMREMNEKQHKLTNQVDFIELNTILRLWKEINDLKKADENFAGEDMFINLAFQELNTTSQEMQVETRTINLEFNKFKLKYYEFNDELVKLQGDKRKLQEKIKSVENQMRNLPASTVSIGEPKTNVQNTQTNRVVSKGKVSDKIDKLARDVDYLHEKFVELKKCCPVPVTDDFNSGEI